MISATGLGSGLDINGLVTQLVAAERAGSDLQLDRGKAEISSQLSAFGSLKGSVAGFQNALGSLNNLDNFDKRKASTSDSAAIALSVSDSATPASYSIGVSRLASSHSLASTAFEASDTPLGAGTLNIRFGTIDYDSGTDTVAGFGLNAERAAASIDIDSGNDSLEGIMAAINAAGIGLSASIVNDGTGFRLLLSSDSSGAANAVEISVDDVDGGHGDAAGLSRFAFNSQASHMQQTVEASDALLNINGLPVSSASNSVTGAIEGLTLKLKQVTSENLSVQVAKDTATVTASVNAFIAGYNQFISTVNGLTGYDADNKAAGRLLGDFTVRSIQSQVDRILRNPVAGLEGDFTTLFELGIKSDGDGRLTLDSARFNEVLDSNPDDVRAIFTAFGAPADADIAFLEAGEDTLAGDYAINISAHASAGYLAGAGVLPDFALGASLLIDSDNDNLSLQVDGVETGEITLSAGSYASGQDLAGEIQAQINGSANMREAGLSVTVSYDAGSDSLLISSDALGATSYVNLTAVDAASAATLGFSVADGTPGSDVAGTIGGEAAEGKGNVLTGAAGTAAEGLSLRIGGSALGERGSVNFSQGLASQLNTYLQQILDEDEGVLESRLAALNERSESLEERRARMELRWEAIEARYFKQFNALDTLLAGLQATSTYLEGQLANLPKPYNRNS